MDIEKLRIKLEEKVKEIDERIARLSVPSLYDQSDKIGNLHGEAWAYEKSIEND